MTAQRNARHNVGGETVTRWGERPILHLIKDKGVRLIVLYA